MQEQNQTIRQPEAQQKPVVSPRQPWQRPTLQRLHVSLDTAALRGSDTDGLGGSAFA